MATTLTPLAQSDPVDNGIVTRHDLLTRFGGLIDTKTGVIGRVVGSEKEPSGAHQFSIWAADSAHTLDVGHIVTTFSEEAAVIGVVDEPRRFSDLRSFLDDYYDKCIEEALEEEAPTKRPEILVFTVNVLATRHVRDDVTSQRPAVSGPVYFATPAAIDYALGHQEFSGVPIPALMHTNGNAERDANGNERRDEAGNVVFQRAPIWLDGDYLLGPEAGHANWTGQSGLATKTSHAVFLISSVFQHMKKREGQSVAALMFNVKGPDLLWLDKPADPQADHEARYAAAGFRGLSERDHEAYNALELEPRPFSPFRIFAPFKPGQIPDNHGSVLRLESAPYRGRLNTLRAASGETEDVVFPILWPLKPLLDMPHRVFDRGDLDDKLWGFIYELRELGIGSMDDLMKLFAEIDAHFQSENAPDNWHGHHKATLHKARNRFKSLTSKLGGLVSEKAVEYGSLPRADAAFQDQELRVIDIAGCNSNVQELIVTQVITKIWRMAEEEKLHVDKLVIFVDELNKYAPSGGQGALRDTLVDIAARGRHLNVVLFGAQQFRSKVDDEILGNCGTSLYGRVGDEEITNSAYRSLSATVQDELLGLPKGRLLVRHAHFRAPLFGSFPLPPTVPGMLGQRIFNPSGGAVTQGHVADGLILFLRRHMGDKAPSSAEVRSLADGLSREDLEAICAKVDQAARQSAGRNGSNPWYLAKNLLLRYQERNR
jgi:hypothetical protein